MITTSYTTKIPFIAEAIPLAVGAPVRAGAERIARTAAANAPDRPPPYQGLPASIEARAEEGGDGYGIYAAWYWRFQEFGTKNAAPRPFMLPAAEAEMPSIVTEVSASLRAL